MKKRAFSLLLAAVILLSVVPQMGLQVRADAFILDPQQIDGSSFSSVYAGKLNSIFRGEVALFSNSNGKFPLGTSLNNNTVYAIADGAISGYQCYIYAQAVYYYLFGDVIYHGDGYRYWSDSVKVLTNKKTVSYSMFRDAKVGFGAYIRTTGNSNGSYSSSKGHSLIVLDYDVEGITYLEGNADGKGLVRVTRKTWNEFNNHLLTGKSRRVCHVVQCYSAMCQHLAFTQQGQCCDCGQEFDYAVTFRDDCMGYYSVSLAEGAVMNTQKPYTPEETDAVTLETGLEGQVHGQLTNAFGQTWYHATFGEHTGYVNADALTWTAYAPQQITGNLASPLEGAVLPQASYPVEGKVTSLYPLGEVVGELDGEVFATVTPVNAKTLDIQSSAINRDLSFAAMEPGEHTLTIKARDIHREEYVTVCERTFTIREAEKTPQASSGIPLRIARNASTGKPVLSWDKVSGATKYEIYRATSENGKYTKRTTTTKLTYTDTKASAGTMYFYKIRVIGSKSPYNKQYSGIAACWTACARPSVTDTNDAASGMPKLSWKAVTGAVGYRIYRCLPGQTEYTLLAEQTGKTFLDKTAPVDTVCMYQVQAVGRQEALDSALTAPVQVTAALARPSLKADITEDGYGIISWKQVEGASGYRIYRSSSSGKSYKEISVTEDTAYTDLALTAGKTYYYKVVALGQNSKSAYSSYVKATGRCAVPELTGEVNTSGKPVLSWDKIAGAKKYEIQRSVNGGAFKKVTTTTKRTYTDTKATPGALCVYRVRAIGSRSTYNSLFSQQWGCNVLCAKPAASAKTDAATGKPVISWKKVTGAVSYGLYRSVDGGEFEYLAATSGTTYTDRDAQLDQQYRYQVIAMGKENVFNSAPGNAVACAPVCARPAVTGKVDASGKPALSWKEVEGAAGYAVYRSTSKTKGYQRIDQTEDLSYTDITAKKNKTYYYKIMALTENSQSAQSGYVKLKAKK